MYPPKAGDGAHRSLGIISGFGDNGGGETPVPFPNTEVKPSSADGTAGVTRRESRSLPSTFFEPQRPTAGGARIISRGRPAGARPHFPREAWAAAGSTGC